jgi:hypothetical protein
MNKESFEKNYEIALLGSVILCFILPVYLGVFLICSVVAAGRGRLYTERLDEFLKNLAAVKAIEVVDTTPITRSRNRKRRGSE